MSVLEFKRPFRSPLDMYLCEPGLTRIVVDPYREGADLPAAASRDENGLVHLNISRKLASPLREDENGLSCRLTFNGMEHDVFVPWSSIVAAGKLDQ